MMPNGWPAERPPIDPTKPHKAGNGGRHGDIKDVAYLFVWKAWKKPIEDYGKIMSANYGKIHGILRARFSMNIQTLDLTYYLNGKPNERSLEWDRKTNLFKAPRVMH